MPEPSYINRHEGPLDDAAHAEVVDLFTYHPPSSVQIAKMETVRAAGVAFYEAILANAPASPTRTRALNAITDARMFANAAIIHNGKH